MGQAGLWHVVFGYMTVTVSEVSIKLCYEILKDCNLETCINPDLTNIDCRDGVRQVNEGNCISNYISNTFLEL
jgi:hypothetical protein